LQQQSNRLIRIGISGWRYTPWRGRFYPRGLAQRAELEFASRAFSTIEINGSFYSLQRPESYAEWRDEAPAGFTFAVKGNRYITHFRHLRNVEKSMANFLSSGVFNLEAKLGPFLWQLPPRLTYRPEVIEDFLALLPRDTASALALARRREPRMYGRSRLAIDRNRRLRHALEVRHESFRNEQFIRQLRAHKVALVVADTAGKWPYLEEVTCDFMYLRLHGDKKLYTSGYTDEALRRWAERIRLWSTGSQPPDAARVTALPIKRRNLDIYCYFDNDAKVKAPFDARRLELLLTGTTAKDPLILRRAPANTRKLSARSSWPAGWRPVLR
jgi:uncharacterized protein YecE (DUF72 family)